MAVDSDGRGGCPGRLVLPPPTPNTATTGGTSPNQCKTNPSGTKHLPEQTVSLRRQEDCGPQKEKELNLPRSVPRHHTTKAAQRDSHLDRTGSGERICVAWVH